MSNSSPPAGVLVCRARWCTAAIFTAAIVVIALASIAPALPQDTPPRSIRDLFKDDYDLMLYGSEKNAMVGTALAFGDVNGDGLDDLIVGAELADVRAEPSTLKDAGATYVYFGRRGNPTAVDLERDADLIFAGGAHSEHSGHALAAGDLNGDGIDDIVIGAPSGVTRDPHGATYVVFGRRSFPERANMSLAQGGADVTLRATIGSYSGTALALLDFNGDGTLDLAIGAPFADEPTNDAGNTFLVTGRPSWPARIELSEGSCLVFTGVSRGDRSGMALAGGDFDGDGMDDLAIGGIETNRIGVQVIGRNVGLVSVFRGRPAPPATLSLERASFRIAGNNTNDYIGSALAFGDVDADGAADLLVGGPFSDVDLPGEDTADNAGGAFLFYGGETGLFSLESTADADMAYFGDAGGWRKGSTFYGAFAGAAVKIADLDADGFGDLIIAAPLADSRGAARPRPEEMQDVGAVYVVSGQGRSTGITRLHDAFSTAIFGFREGDYFGGVFGEPVWSSSRYDRVFSPSLATGDFNGDGVLDVAVGAPGADGARSLGDTTDDAGAAYVFFGRR